MATKFSKLLVCVGSTALSHRGFSPRKPSDLDLVGSYQAIHDYCKRLGKIQSFIPIESGKKIIANVATYRPHDYYQPFDHEGLIVEAELAWRNSSAQALIEVVANDTDTIIKDGLLIPSLDFLYMLKMSHRYLKDSPFFLKTMTDIHYLRSLGAKINPKHNDFFKQRRDATYNYTHPKLNVNKVDFFKGDGIKYVYDHDSIHEAVKHLEVPAYTFFKEPGSEVLCSKDLFFAAEEKIKLYAVLEEAYVLALERSQIPFRGQVTPLNSFEMALTKVCTSITSGWFREYAWEHWDQVQALKNECYAQNFFEKADAGLVKLHGE